MRVFSRLCLSTADGDKDLHKVNKPKWWTANWGSIPYGWQYKYHYTEVCRFYTLLNMQPNMNFSFNLLCDDLQFYKTFNLTHMTDC